MLHKSCYIMVIFVQKIIEVLSLKIVFFEGFP